MKTEVLVKRNDDICLSKTKIDKIITSMIENEEEDKYYFGLLQSISNILLIADRLQMDELDDIG